MPNSNQYAREHQRLDFAKIQGSIQIPNLIEVQMKSYQRFLQMDLLPSEREDGGLQSVFTSVFPIKDFREMSQLEFVDYSIGNWECKCGNLKGLHHLRATCRNCGASVVTNPYQTGDVICHKCGTFNKNTPTFCNKCGDPVAMQLKYDVNECQERGMTYSAPLRVTIRLTIYDKDPDSGAKTIRDIKEQEVFYGDIPLMTENGTFVINGTERVIVSQLHRSPGVFFESANNRTYFLGKIIPYRGSWVEFEYDQKNVLYVRIDRKRKFLGTIFLRALGLRSSEDILRTFYTVDRLVVRDKKLFFPERDDVGTVISQTLKRDSVKTPQEALIEIYRKLRPGDPPTLDTATALFHGMFFDARKYDFSRVGRLKFNIKLFENSDATSLDKRTLDPDDFYATIRYLLKLRKSIGSVDDLGHLGKPH